MGAERKRRRKKEEKDSVNFLMLLELKDFFSFDFSDISIFSFFLPSKLYLRLFLPRYARLHALHPRGSVRDVEWPVEVPVDCPESVRGSKGEQEERSSFANDR